MPSTLDAKKVEFPSWPVERHYRRARGVLEDTAETNRVRAGVACEQNVRQRAHSVSRGFLNCALLNVFPARNLLHCFEHRALIIPTTDLIGFNWLFALH